MTSLLSQDDFSRRVAELYPKIYLSALAASRDADTAQDVTQEAFLRAYLHRDKLHQPEELGAWVYGIACKITLQWQRDGRNRSRLVPLIPLEEVTMHPPDNSPSPREAAVRTESGRQLADAVMALPEELREVILLHYTEGMTASDIARLKGEAVSTVTRRLERAILQLRKQMESTLLSGLAALRPPTGHIQRTVALIAATAGLSAGAKAQLLGLAGDVTVAPSNIGKIASQSVDKVAGMKTFLVSPVGKLAAVGAVLLIGGVVTVRSINHKPEQPVVPTHTHELNLADRGVETTRIGLISGGKLVDQGGEPNDVASTGGRHLDRSGRSGEYLADIRKQERAKAKTGPGAVTTTALMGRPPRPGEIPRVNQKESTGTITGYVYDPEGRAVDAQVQTYAWWYPDLSNIPSDIDRRLIQPQQGLLSDSTDESGYFELKHLPYGSKLTMVVMTDEYAVHTQTVNVPTQNLKITLKPARKRVYGRVLNLKDDTPVVGAKVNLLISGEMKVPFGSEMKEAGSVFGTGGSIRTNEEGIYETFRFRDCMVQLDAETANLSLVTSEGSVHRKSAVITAGDEPQEIPPIYVYEGHIIVGTVRDAKTKEPIPDVIINIPFFMGMKSSASSSNISDLSDGSNTVTDETGNYVLTGVRPPLQPADGSPKSKGSAFNRISASHPDYITGRQEPKVLVIDKNNLEIRLDFELTPRR